MQKIEIQAFGDRGRKRELTVPKLDENEEEIDQIAEVGKEFNHTSYPFGEFG